jgi:hypothetical protein
MDTSMFQALFVRRMLRDFLRSLGNPFVRVPTGTQRILLKNIPPTHQRIGCTYLYTLVSICILQFSNCLIVL